MEPRILFKEIRFSYELVPKKKRIRENNLFGCGFADAESRPGFPDSAPRS
jgi:hypothetical protein